MIVANKQKNGLKKQSNGNFTLASNSPDLNPIENVWVIIKGNYKRKILVREAFLLIE